jgi:hypothetical protein
LILKEPTKIVEKLSLNSNYSKTSLDGLTLTKSLRQFHDLQRNIHRLIATTFDLVVESIKKEIKFRTIRPRSSIVDTTTNNCVHQILRHVSSSEFCKKKSDKKIRNTPVDNLLASQ